MLRHRCSRAFVLAAVAALLAASVARASWSSSTRGGSLAVTSGVLAAPTGLAAANGTCRRRVSIAVSLTWTASSSPFADGYEIFRGSGSGGPYTSLGTVTGGGTTTYTDTTTAFRTTYYYVVQATRYGWRSPSSAEATLTTFRSTCR